MFCPFVAIAITENAVLRQKLKIIHLFILENGSSKFILVLPLSERYHASLCSQLFFFKAFNLQNSTFTNRKGKAKRRSLLSSLIAIITNSILTALTLSRSKIGE